MVKSINNVIVYLKDTRDQIRPMMLAYVLGFLINFRQTIINIKRIITLAAGICFADPSSGTATVLGLCSAAAESKPSFILSLSPPISPRTSSVIHVQIQHFHGIRI